MKFDPHKAALMGIMAPIASVVMVIILGWLTPGHNHKKNMISELGALGTGYEVIFSVVMILVGIMFVILAFALYERLPKNQYTKAACVLLGIFGIFSCVGTGIFPCDYGCEGENLRAQIHLVTNGFAFTLFTFAPIIFSFGIVGSKWHLLQPINVTVQFLGLVFFVLFAVNYFFGSYEGFYQRLYLTVCYFWIAALAMELYSLTRKSKKAL